MSAALWFMVGAFVGFDVAIGCAWLSMRRSNRGRELRWRVTAYTGRRPW